MAVYAFSDGISKAMPFLVFPIVAYMLTPAEFGLVSNFNVLCQVIFAFTLLNTHTYLTVEYYKINEEQKQSLILNIFILVWALLGLSSVITLLFNNIIFHYTELTIRWQLYALIWVGFNAVIYIYQAKLRLDEKAKYFGIYQVTQSVLSAGFTLLFVVLLKWGWQGRIESLVISNVVIGGVGLYFLLKQSLFSAKFNVLQIKNAFLFGIPLLPHTLSFWLKNGMDKIYITNIISITENGIFTFAGMLASIFFMITAAFLSAYNPHLFKTLASIESYSNEDEKRQIRKKLLIQLKYFILVYALANILGYFVIKLGIEIFFFEKYGTSLKYIPWLQLVGFMGVFYAIFSAYVFYTKSTKILGVITVSTAILQATLNYFAVIHFGVYGIISVSLITALILAVCVGFYSNKVYPMPWRYLFSFSFNY